MKSPITYSPTLGCMSDVNGYQVATFNGDADGFALMAAFNVFAVCALDPVVYAAIAKASPMTARQIDAASKLFDQPFTR